MSPFKTILVPTDFTVQYTEAFRTACTLAVALNARVVLLHVEEPIATGFSEYYPLALDPLDSHDASLRRLTAVEAPVPKVRLERHLTEGLPAERIIRFAAEYPCDLIVMGTHGRSGLGRLLLGSVAEQVVRKAPCPVLTVKPRLAEPSRTNTERMKPAEV